MSRAAAQAPVGTAEAGPRRAIVTGGAGFVGSHLVDRLRATGTEVLVVDDLSTGNAANLPPAVHLERLDIAEADLGRLFRDWRPTVVYHLAAQASVPASTRDPLRDLAVNVVGTHRVAAAAGRAGVGRLVFVSSGGAIYGECARPATERTLPAPSSYYGIHKLAAEGHIRVAGLPHAIARPSNIYGPRQAPGLEGAVVAAFLDQAARLGRLTVHGDGRQTRDFIHVRDVVAALVLLGSPDRPDGTWNISSGRRTSVARLAALVAAALGREVGRESGPRRVGDVLHSAMSSASLRKLGWRSTVDLATGIGELAGNVGPVSTPA